MRYSRHKRSGISYGCHNESTRTTFSCHKRSCFATSYPLSMIYCRCCMYRRFGVGVSADDCSLLPPPSGSSMAMQINARTHSEPFMATNSFHIPPPQTFYANAIFPHTLDLLWQWGYVYTQTLLTLFCILIYAVYYYHPLFIIWHCNDNMWGDPKTVRGSIIWHWSDNM